MSIDRWEAKKMAHDEAEDERYEVHGYGGRRWMNDGSPFERRQHVFFYSNSGLERRGRMRRATLQSILPQPKPYKLLDVISWICISVVAVGCVLLAIRWAL